MRSSILRAIPAVVMALMLLSGCSKQTVNSAQNDLSNDITSANQSANQAAASVAPKMDALELGTRVTAAIDASSKLPHSQIRVDAQQGSVRLRGKVDTSAQKQLAGKIASDTVGPGQTVDNELTVRD